MNKKRLPLIDHLKKPQNPALTIRRQDKRVHDLERAPR